jgi:formylglycine-generating enzyme required for sulfatase activity
VEKGWEGAEKVWNKLKPKVTAKPAAQDAIERAVKQPENKRVQDNLQTNLEFQLEDIFGEDSTLAKFVAENVTFDLSSNINTGERSIVGTVNGVANTGDNPIFVTDGGRATFLLDPRFDQTPVEKIPNEELTFAYLRALASECSELPLGIVDPRFLEKAGKDSITLPGVYIDLDVQPPSTEERTKQKTEEPIFERERENRVPVLEALTDPTLRHLVLLGDPGSGKTTCLHYLTYALSLSKQNDPSASELFPENWQLKSFFPIRLVLREVAAQHIPAGIKKGSPEIIWNALRAELVRLLGKDIASALFPKLEERILKQPCLLMLDGLDEVTETDSRRERLIEAIHHFSALLAKESCVLVTARPYAYTDSKWQLPGFKTLTLLPFNKDQIERFISRWYLAVRKSMKWDKIAATERGQSLNSAIKEKEYLFDLAARPLLLTLMSTLHTSWGKLPEDRADLYDQIVSLLLNRWQRWRDTRDQDGNIYTEKSISIALSIEEGNIRKALNKLAYAAHTRQGHDSNRQPAPADIRQEEVLDAFSSYLPDTVHPRVIINYLETRAGLLLGRGNGIYSFPHRSFQEYLAACYLNDQIDPASEYSERIQQDPAWWREVFLLGIGKMSRGGLGTAVAALQTLWLNLPLEAERADKDWQAVTLAGQAVTEMKLGADTTRYEKLITPIRNSLVTVLEQNHLTPRERAEAGNTLAKLGDPRPGVSPLLSGEGLGVRSMNLLFCEIPAGKFLMGNTKETDSTAYDDEMPQFEYNIKHTYFMSRYPITNAQFNLFVDDPAGYTNEQWYTEAGKQWRKESKQDRPPKQGDAFDLSNHPVVNVTWYESATFCKWLTAQMQNSENGMQVYDPATLSIRMDANLKSEIVNRKYEIRLPSEAEWEKAARHSPLHQGEGVGVRVFPWGNDFEQDRVNNNNIIGTTSAVGSFPAGQTPYGLLDMSGNVWEWCSTQWTDNYDGYLKKENNKLEGNVARVVRGGAYFYNERFVRCAVRYRDSPIGEWNYLGFRVVVASLPISLPPRSGS